MRSLEREIGAVLRKIARQVVKSGPDVDFTIDRARVRSLLGKAKFRSHQIQDKAEVGLTTGLAWTEVGGEILTTEVALSRGKGTLTLTGKLGDVMQESARAALSYVRSRAELFGLDPDVVGTVSLAPLALGRTGTVADDIAPLIRMLAGADSHHLTGATLNADGGLWMTS